MADSVEFVFEKRDIVALMLRGSQYIHEAFADSVMNAAGLLRDKLGREQVTKVMEVVVVDGLVTSVFRTLWESSRPPDAQKLVIQYTIGTVTKVEGPPYWIGEKQEEGK